MRVWIACGLLLCSVSLTGCPESKEQKTGNQDSVQKDAATPKAVEVKPDDPAAVAALEKLGVNLTKNDAGSVVKADFRTVEYTPEDLGQLAGLPSLVDVHLEATEPGTADLAKLNDLTQLKILRLIKCMISEEGMAQLAGLKNLEQLYLINNSSALTDDALAHVVNYPKLRVLDLRGCILIGDDGLKHLQALKNLERLKLRSDRVTDTGIGYLKGLTKLRGFVLEDASRITDDSLKTFSDKTGIDEIGLMRTPISDEGLAHLSKLNKLKQLDLRGTVVYGGGFEHLTGAKDLWKVDVSEAEVDDEGLGYIAAMPNLQDLNLWYSAYLTDAGLEHLKSLTKLRRLNLEQTPIGDAGLEHLAGITSLESLNLSETKITDEGLPSLSGLTGLKTLELARTEVSDAAVEKLHAALPNCQIKR